jgi:hypothetical protein
MPTKGFIASFSLRVAQRAEATIRLSLRWQIPPGVRG